MDNIKCVNLILCLRLNILHLSYIVLKGIEITFMNEILLLLFLSQIHIRSVRCNDLVLKVTVRPIGQWIYVLWIYNFQGPTWTVCTRLRRYFERPFGTNKILLVYYLNSTLRNLTEGVLSRNVFVQSANRLTKRCTIYIVVVLDSVSLITNSVSLRSYKVNRDVHFFSDCTFDVVLLESKVESDCSTGSRMFFNCTNLKVSFT